MTELIKILGLPGTGKTTTMLNMIKQDLSKGVKLDAICANTFRRKMSIEIKNRLRKEIDMLEEEFKESCIWFASTHGICKRVLGTEKGQIISESDKSEFCKKQGVEYKKSNKGDVYEIRSSTLGEQLFNIKKYLVENMLEFEMWEKCTGVEDFVDLDSTQVRHFLDEWENYKKKEGKIDFDDMLLFVYKNKIKPPFSVLYWDEYQDVTPIQHEICKMWAKDCEKVVIAGDPNQCIYDFWGASPKFFDEWNVKPVILKHSYRLRRNIWNFCKHIRNKKLPNLEMKDGGEVKIFNLSDIEPLIKLVISESLESNVCFLLRTNYMCREIAKILDSKGVPFIGPYGWTKKQFIFLDGLLKTRQGKEPNKEYIKYFIDSLPSSFFSLTKKEIKKRDELNLSEVKKLMSSLDKDKILKNPFDYFLPSKKFSNKVLERMERVLYGLKEVPNKIEISTIHGKKGGESDVIVLFTSITNKIVKNIEENPDSENRVFFTGATRVKEKLFVVSGYFDGPDHIKFLKKQSIK